MRQASFDTSIAANGLLQRRCEQYRAGHNSFVGADFGPSYLLHVTANGTSQHWVVVDLSNINAGNSNIHDAFITASVGLEDGIVLFTRSTRSA